MLALQFKSCNTVTSDGLIVTSYGVVKLLDNF